MSDVHLLRIYPSGCWCSGNVLPCILQTWFIVAHMYIHYICVYISVCAGKIQHTCIYTYNNNFAYFIITTVMPHSAIGYVFYPECGRGGCEACNIYSHLHMYVHMHSAHGVVLPRVNIRSIYLLPCTSCAVVGLYRMFYSWTVFWNGAGYI